MTPVLPIKCWLVKLVLLCPLGFIDLLIELLRVYITHVQAGIMPALVLRRVVHALLKRLLRLALRVVSASQQANPAPNHRGSQLHSLLNLVANLRGNHLSQVVSLRGSLLVNPAVSPPQHHRLLGNVQWVATLRLVSARWFPLVPIFE